MYFPVLLWSLVIFASFWGYGEALRCATAEDFPQKILAASCVLQ
jgi:hypothetical protein